MVPEEWKHRRLSEICTTVTSGSRDWAQYYADDGAKFIRMTNLRRESIWLDLSDLKFVDIQSDSADGKRTSLRAGDILMSITAELGKIGWVNEGLGESYINQHTALIRLNKEKASTMFVAYLLSSQEMNAKINRLNDSGAKAGLNLPTIRAIPLSLPPLPEQKKIAQILSTWDKAITTTEQLLANNQQQKKALMQQLLTGKKRLLNDNGVRFDGEWSKLPFSDLVSLVKAKFDPKANADDVRECIELEHIEQGTSSLSGSTNTTVALSTKTAFDKGDVLFGKLRPYLRKYWKADRQGVCSTEIWVFRTKAKVEGNYIFQVIQVDSFIEVANKSSGTHMPRADWNVVKDFSIPTPPLEEQQKIAAVLSAADQEVAALQQKLDALKQEKKALMQQLLTGKRRVMFN